MTANLLNSLTAGMLAGGLWNAANLWCLSRILGAWMGKRSSRAGVVGWLIVKLAVVYPAAFLLLRHPLVSPLGFAIGFTLVLLIAGASVYLRAQRGLAASTTHGR